MPHSIRGGGRNRVRRHERLRIQLDYLQRTMPRRPLIVSWPQREARGSTSVARVLCSLFGSMLFVLHFSFFVLGSSSFVLRPSSFALTPPTTPPSPPPPPPTHPPATARSTSAPRTRGPHPRACAPSPASP